jgi:hypothetical protein
VSEAVCCWCGAGLVKSASTGVWWCSSAPCREKQATWAISVEDRKKKRTTAFLFVPLPKQVEFMASEARHVLYGGAASPGKSHGLRWALYRRSLLIPGHSSLLMRRTYSELDQHHLSLMPADEQRFRAAGVSVEFAKTERLFRFPNGSTIRAGHMDTQEDVQRYLSAEFDVIAVDEGSTFEPMALMELSTRARTSKDAVRADGGAKFWIASNPGGAATRTLLDFFIDHEPDPDVFPAAKAFYDVKDWVYIPATLDDNPYRDPGYEASLALSLPKWRYEQLRHGDWRVFAGQFFAQWQERVHVRSLGIEDFSDFECFCSMDWGHHAPGVILWWVVLQDGHYHIAREWKFKGLDDEQIAKGYHAVNQEFGFKPRTIYADPSLFSKDGRGRGQSRAETLSLYRMPMQRSDNDRVNGWARCHDLLRLAPDGTPWLTVDEACAYGRRSVPAMMSKDGDPEDVDSDGDDHWVDAWRYGAIKHLPNARRKARTAPAAGTLGWYKRQESSVPEGVLRRRSA